MPTRRTPIARTSRPHITPAAIAAWQAADFHALHAALGLKPWERSPLPQSVSGLGVEEGCAPVEPSTASELSYPKALALQRALVAVAGWPVANASQDG